MEVRTGHANPVNSHESDLKYCGSQLSEALAGAAGGSGVRVTNLTRILH